MGRKILDFFLFLLVLAGCAALIVATAGGDYFSMTCIYNYAFLGIMAFVYLVALFGGIFRMANITDYFRTSSQQIDAMSDGDAVTLEDQVNSLETYRPLRRNLDRFLQDYGRSKSGICDIEDYINEDETDSLIHKRLLDLVPELLTSLGILGTFMGLVWGLRAFQPSNYEAMTSSVTSLVNGIKVAFLTSIFGLSLSLVCSYSLRTGYQKMGDALQDFLDRFHTRLVPSAAMEAQNRMVKGQKEQNALIRSLTAEFSDQVAHGFAANMAPTLERINNQLGDMMNSISNNQQLFLQDIVTSFVKEMKASFRTEFTDFGETLKSVNDSMNRNIRYTEQAYTKMADEMRAMFAADENAMRQSVREIAAAQKAVGDSVAAMSAQMGQVTKDFQAAQEGSLRNLSRAEQESSKFWVACNQAMQNYLTEAANAYDKFEKANDATDRVLTAITATYQKNEKLIEEYNKSIRDFQETQRKMNESLEEIRRLFYQMDVAGSDGKTIYLYPGMSRQSKESEARMISQVGNLIQESEERQGEKISKISKDVKELKDKKKSKWFG